MKLSVIIPSYKDPLLHQTIDSLLENSGLGSELEIIAVLDGYTPVKEVKNNPQIRVLRLEQNRGMRNAINAGVDISKGKYIMKCDEHCMFDKGFDVKLLADIEDNWVVIPRRYKLDIEKWIICEDDKEPIDYERLVLNRPDRICGVEWRSRAFERKDMLLDETMVFQGSCYALSRKHWDLLGGLQEEGYGKFAQEAIEIALKTWLGGGKVMVNKTTWYAHKHRKYGRAYTFSTKKDIEPGNTYSRDFWLNNKWEKRARDLKWLFDRFTLEYNPSV